MHLIHHLKVAFSLFVITELPQLPLDPLLFPLEAVEELRRSVVIYGGARWLFHRGNL